MTASQRGLPRPVAAPPEPEPEAPSLVSPAPPPPAATGQGRAAWAAAQRYARRSMAPATLRAYRADWRHYAAWCEAAGLVPLPAAPATVGAYLASLAETHAPTTLRRRLAAIGQMHRYNGLGWNPGHLEIRATLKGVLAEHGRPLRQAAAIRLAELRRLVETCDDGPAGRRDRALLLLGFAGALRRAELVALDVADVVPTPEGLRLRIRRSKTDQERAGAEIGIPRGRHPATCPVRAVEAWRAALVHRSGPLFRRISKAGRIGHDRLWPDAVRFLLLRRARLAGLRTEGPEGLTAHGLRAGFITEAYDRGIRDEDIMRHSRHRDLRTMRGYVRRARLVGESPAGLVGL